MKKFYLLLLLLTVAISVCLAICLTRQRVSYSIDLDSSSRQNIKFSVKKHLITHADIASLHDIGLENKIYLNLSGREIEPACFRLLRDMQNLDAINLGGSSTSDLDLENLCHNQHIHELDLGMTRISTSGLMQLERAKGLRKLDLSYIPLSVDAIESVLQLPNLTELRMRGAGLPSDMSSLKWNKCDKLTVLDIAETSINDTQLRSVSNIPNLSILCIDDNQSISGKGLGLIDNLRNLKHMYIDKNILTKSEYQAFKQSHPNLVIHFSRSRPDR